LVPKVDRPDTQNSSSSRVQAGFKLPNKGVTGLRPDMQLKFKLSEQRAQRHRATRRYNRGTTGARQGHDRGTTETDRGERGRGLGLGVRVKGTLSQRCKLARERETKMRGPGGCMSRPFSANGASANARLV
jgi:hypothetical protein